MGAILVKSDLNALKIEVSKKTFFIEEIQFSGTFFVIDIFWKLQFFQLFLVTRVHMGGLFIYCWKLLVISKRHFLTKLKEIRLQCDFVTLGLQKSYSERHAKGFCHCHAICMEFMSRSFGTNSEPEHYSTNRFTAALLPGNNRNIGFRVFVFEPKGKRESISLKSL